MLLAGKPVCLVTVEHLNYAPLSPVRLAPPPLVAAPPQQQLLLARPSSVTAATASVLSSRRLPAPPRARPKLKPPPSDGSSSSERAAASGATRRVLGSLGRGAAHGSLQVRVQEAEGRLYTAMRKHCAMFHRDCPGCVSPRASNRPTEWGRVAAAPEAEEQQQPAAGECHVCARRRTRPVRTVAVQCEEQQQQQQQQQPEVAGADVEQGGADLGGGASAAEAAEPSGEAAGEGTINLHHHSHDQHSHHHHSHTEVLLLETTQAELAEARAEIARLTEQLDHHHHHDHHDRDHDRDHGDDSDHRHHHHHHHHKNTGDGGGGDAAAVAGDDDGEQGAGGTAGGGASAGDEAAARAEAAVVAAAVSSALRDREVEIRVLRETVASMQTFASETPALAAEGAVEVQQLLTQLRAAADMARGDGGGCGISGGGDSIGGGRSDGSGGGGGSRPPPAHAPRRASTSKANALNFVLEAVQGGGGEQGGGSCEIATQTDGSGDAAGRGGSDGSGRGGGGRFASAPQKPPPKPSGSPSAPPHGGKKPLKGNGTGVGVSDMKGMRKAGTAQPLINTCALIANIYDAKIEAELVDARTGNEPQEFSKFCETFLLMRFGLKTVARKQLRNLVSSVQAHAADNLRCWQFAQLAGIHVPDCVHGARAAAAAAGGHGEYEQAYFPQAASFYLRLLSAVFSHARHEVAARFAPLEGVLVDKAEVVAAAHACFTPTVFEAHLRGALDEIAAEAAVDKKTGHQNVDIDRVLRCCMEAWPIEVGEQMHEAEDKAAHAMQMVVKMHRLVTQATAMLKKRREARQKAELQALFSEVFHHGEQQQHDHADDESSSSSDSHAWKNFCQAMSTIDSDLDVARVAELFELCLEAAEEKVDADGDGKIDAKELAAATGVSEAEAAAKIAAIDANGDGMLDVEDCEPEISQEVFVECVTAYGYRKDFVLGKWVRDHPPHTQYVTFGGKIIAKDVVLEERSQRRRCSAVVTR